MKTTDIAKLKAKDLMSKPLSISGDAGIKEAVRFLLTHGFSGAPVIDDAGKAVGVISFHDIARYAEWHLEADDADERAEIKTLDGDEEDVSKNMTIDHLKDITVRQVMTPKICKVKSDDGFPAIMKALLSGPYHRIFVADAKGALVGVISSMDVIRVVAKTL